MLKGRLPVPVVPRDLRNHSQLRSHFFGVPLHLYPPERGVHRVLALAWGSSFPSQGIVLVTLQQQRYTNITFA